MLFNLSWDPGRKETQFAIISIVGKKNFWTDQDDFTVAHDNSAVVLYSLMHDRPSKTSVKRTALSTWANDLHANIQNHILGFLTLENLSKYFPTMQIGITFKTIRQ